MKKILILITTFLLTLNILFGLELLNTPKKYKKPTDGISLRKTNDTNTDSWIVFSDKQDNPTYYEQRKGRVKKKCAFMQHFYIIDETDDWLHIVKDNPGWSGETTKEMEDYGWIKKENLLLWSNCLNTNTNIKQKVMVLNSMATIENEEKISYEHRKMQFYNDPYLNDLSDKVCELYQIFYVYKTSADGTNKLIGKSSSIRGGEYAKTTIWGWVSKSRMVEWYSRLAIEPNWEPDAVDERRNNDVQATAFSSESQATRFKLNNDTHSSRAIYWAEDENRYNNRAIGEWRRFPVLTANNNIMQCYIMGEVQSDAGNIDTEENAVTIKKYTDLRENMRNVNIIFVIDGTSSMQPYFSQVSNALKSCMPSLERTFTKNDFKFSAVVFRDFASKRVIEFQKLGGYEQTANFLSNIVAGDDYGDTDSEEAVNYGLKHAIRNNELIEGQTNIIVLIGDAANHDRQDNTQVSSNTIERLLDKYGCDFFVFQVHKKNTSAYKKFVIQNKKIMLTTATKEFNRLRAIAGNELSEPQFQTNGRIHSLNNSSRVMRLSEAQLSNSSSNSLSSDITELIELSNKKTGDFIALLEEIMEGGTSLEKIDFSTSASDNKFVDSYKPAMFSMLNSMGLKDDVLDKIKKERFQLAIEAYTPVKIDNMQHPLYKDVVLFDRIELGKLYVSLQKLIEGGGVNERKTMQDAWLEILRDTVGEDREAFKNMTLGEVNIKVTGLHSTSDFIADIRVEDITDPSVFTDNDFRKYLDNLNKSFIKLDEIYNSKDYPYSFRSNDTPYYWIELDILP